MGLSQVTPPAIEPITLIEAKKQVEIPTASTAHDTLLTGLIIAARELVEVMTRRALLEQTWRLTLSKFACEIPLPRPNLLAVSTVSYLDSDGVWQTLDSSKYQVTSGSSPAFVAPAIGETWPDTHSEALEAVKVTYTAGYGSSADDIPQGIKQALLMLVDYWFERRDGLHSELLNLEAPQNVVWLLKSFQCGMVLGAYEVTQ